MKRNAPELPFADVEQSAVFYFAYPRLIELWEKLGPDVARHLASNEVRVVPATAMVVLHIVEGAMKDST